MILLGDIQRPSSTRAHMCIRGAVAAAVVMLTVLTRPTGAQGLQSQLNPADAQLRVVLRAFYFNLAHHDSQAIAADVLSAKVVASWRAPAGLESATRDHSGTDPSATTHQRVTCPVNTWTSVKEATIRLDGDWAGVSVARCGVASAGVDEFRLIYFEKRWRFVYIDLFEEPILLSTDP